MTTVDGDTAASHKSTVLALKEIATGNIDLGQGAQDFAALDLLKTKWMHRLKSKYSLI